ncbi:hypothetical protein GOP47_0006003 [Adiantum capillus-veneris]|uniref:O-fucosyltransferase family protein n=1 Tax=Adiantum capillus-veneris TaxID=13818 RepID=A0A9D4V2X6_ADICA|nr:hypothetical protein GOP47_0006003 [Adiantum capillus-veneris]
MHRHSRVLIFRKKFRSGSIPFRLLWMIGYVGVTMVALLSVLLLPALLSKFKVQTVLYVHQEQGDSFQVNGTGWTQGKPPLASRTVHSQHLKELMQLDRKSYSGVPNSRGYLLVHANGGLNQMRAGICDMVAVARLINATLVIPQLDKRSFWQDSSTFSDVFDEEYFMTSLENDISVVKKLPKEFLSAPKAHKHFRSWSNAKYYHEEIAQLWEDYKIIHAAKSDSRLANNELSSSIQKLRCRVHYDALRFAPPIEALGKKLLDRMRSNGPFIALHLRYEKDMLAFSGCSHGLSNAEIEELTRIRESTSHWKVKLINSTEQRMKGLCPLTPKEVGIFLQALGYPSTTRIYIAAGEIYGGNDRMVELLLRFPNLMSKEVLATPNELAPFHRHASQLAALDYIVSVESDVFVPSYSGNMARAVEGHRRFLGHRKTISPDRSQLVVLFDQLDQGLLQEGPQFSSVVVELHKRRQGAPRKRRGPLAGSKSWERFRTEEAFYTNPLPDCLCQRRKTLHTNQRRWQPP